MLPLGLGRNSAGLLRALRTPIPRSPGLPDAAGSGVLSGWRNLRRKPCRIRLCRRFSLRASGMPSCAFLRRSARAKPEPFVARQSRRVAALASAADAGRIARTHCPGEGLACAASAFGALPEAKAARPSCRACRAGIPVHRRAFACERREAAFPAMFRRLGASPFCRGALTGFSCVSGRMAETHAAGKALTPARSRKRAECGRPGLPHSG